MTRETTLSARSAILRDAIAIVRSEYGDDLLLDDVAVRVATSRRQLQRCFIEQGQTTFRAYLRHVRMCRAAELLETTIMPVNQVAHRVGYRQPAQFAKAFRRQFGVAPNEYRSDRRATRMAPVASLAA
jgi:transcriptional regulator GlxA family with amidase domain